jgi:hypothetical protein
MEQAACVLAIVWAILMMGAILCGGLLVIGWLWRLERDAEEWEKKNDRS